MEKMFEREAYLLGEEKVNMLHQKHVAVFGIGGVGGHAAEALVRAGIGHLSIIDGDIVEDTNRNRQLVATKKTVGRVKTEVLKERLLEVWPECQIDTYPIFLKEETLESFPFENFDYVLDCIDDVPAKVYLVQLCYQMNIPMISAMGAGNKLNPALFEVADLAKTSVCPLAKVMRKKCKEIGITHVKCVYSKEEPKPVKEAVGSISFVPPVMGLIMAGECMKDLGNIGE